MATIKNRTHRLAALLGGIFVAAFVCVGGIWAQEEATPLYGGPHMGNPGAIPPEELKRNEQIYEEYCRHQPDQCAMGFKYNREALKELGESKRYRGPYVPPEPGHATDCHQDPNNPEKPICVHK